MASDPFEEELFELLGDYDSPVDKEQAWQELQSKLPEPTKRRVFPFWLIFFAFIIVGGIAVYAYTLGQGVQDNISLSNAEIKLNENLSTPSGISNVVVNTKNNKSNKGVSEDGSINTISNNNEQKNPEQKLNENVRNTNNLTSNSSSVEKSTSTIDNNNDRIAISKLKKSDIFQKGSSVFTQQVSQQSFTTQRKENHVKDNLQVVNIAGVSEFKTFGINNKPPADISLLSNLSIAPQFLASSRKAFTQIPNFAMISRDKKVSAEKCVRWETKFYLEYGKLNQNRLANKLAQEEIVAWLDDTEKELDYASIGLEFHRQVSTYVSVFSGIEYSGSRSTFSYIDKLSVMREIEVLQKAFYLDGSVVDNTTKENREHLAYIDAKLTQTYQQLSIPLGISFHSSKRKRFYIQSDFATHLSIFQNNTGQKIILDNNDYEIVNNNDFAKRNFQSFHFKFIIGAKLNSSSSLQLGLSKRWDLSSRLNLENVYDLKMSHSGLHLGISKFF